jgi:acyl dehydratase
MGATFPGYGSIYLSQTLDFKRPVYPGETYRVAVKIEEIDPKGRARLATTITHDGTGKVVLSGEAWALLPKKS